MSSSGILIAIEGIDGAGKRTQADLLAGALEARGIPCAAFSFPRYKSHFGQLVARFLNGEFGPLEAVDPHFSALLYAGDRFEAKAELQEALATGRAIITDRYIASNLAHQTARVEPGQRAAFLDWLRQVEYGIYGLPVEDLVVLLRRTPAEAQRMVANKDSRDYTSQKHDLQESNLDHLQQAAQIYDKLAREENWVIIECSARATLLAPEEIHRSVLDAVESRIISKSAGS